MKKLQSVEEVSQLIQQGMILSLAGDERALSQLPKGQWVAGTTPYFMSEQQGEFSQEMIYVDVISDSVIGHNIMDYTCDTISGITSDRFDNGYTILVIPAFSQLHSDYALHAGDFEGIYDSPVLGWVSGIDLNSEDKPKIYNGMTGKSSSDHGVALHIQLPPGKMAQLEIINIHHQNPDSPVLEFEADSFQVKNCTVDGVSHNFAQYLTDNGVDIKSPLISDYSGAVINVCIKEVNMEAGTVDFYAPVFRGREYKFAIHLQNYADEFAGHLPAQSGAATFSCNCILNFLYGELEGKQAGFPGPITFGEIGYQLLNQTMTYLNIVDIS
ncbi:hypothetical protein ACH42_11615 [Endozoicomonas sp. (ex Bugula neritina AB1)]|nr:hypothetical protein ACH42_11615 [Endozoicomonas sp. (ex Bugula neritina AB1)]